MKGLAQVFVPLVVLASSCASTSRPSEMPGWSPQSVEIVASQQSAAHDTGKLRVPRPDEELPKLWPASGLYIGGALITSMPSDDFDGGASLAGPTDVLLVPDTDIGAGAGLYLSYRWRMNEMVVQYSITEHDGDVSGSPADHDVTFFDLDLNWRHYFLEKSPFQPYGLLGFGWGRAEIENGSTTQAAPFATFQDAELRDGVSFNVGAGAALYTLPWVVFYGQAMYRFVDYASSHGIDGDLPNDPNIDGDGWNISFGAAIRVLPPRKSLGGP